MLVVDYLTAKWADDPKMDDYLRPSTLFGPENALSILTRLRNGKSAKACVSKGVGNWR
jgi:uncharacterized phage protein (TIGR02220 family)